MSEFLEVNWGEGMFLRPHHFQQASRASRALMNQEIAVARSYGWGVHELSIAESELETETLAIRSCSIRMKDGTWIVAPDNAEFEPRDFKKALDAAKGALDVYIGVPLRMDREPNTLMLYEETAMHARRYKAAVLSNVDENTGDNAQPVEVRKLNAHIIFAGEDMTGFSVMKLLTIERSGFQENKPVISPRYIPPLLEMGAWKPLFETVRDIYHQLFAKNRSLVSQIAGRKISFGSEGVGGPEAMLKLSITNRYVGFLKQVTGTPYLHPFDVFMQLCALAGDLAVFDPSRAMPDLPIYDHDDLWLAYSQLIEILQRLIGLLLPTMFVKRRFEPADRWFEVALEDKWLSQEVQFFVGIESDEGLEDVQRKEGTLCFASPTFIEKVALNRRAPGLKRVFQHRVPLGLPDRPNLFYFRVERSPDFWPDVLNAKILGLSFPPGVQPYFEVDLYILLKPAEEDMPKK